MRVEQDARTCSGNIRYALEISYVIPLRSLLRRGVGQIVAQSRPITPEGWFRRVGASRRGRRRESCRCSRSGVEDPTDENARRNSGILEGAGAFASLCSDLPLHGGCSGRAAPRCSRDVHLRCYLSKCHILFDTARLDLRLSTRHLLFPLSLVNPGRGCIRAL